MDILKYFKTFAASRYSMGKNLATLLSDAPVEPRILFELIFANVPDLPQTLREYVISQIESRESAESLESEKRNLADSEDSYDSDNDSDNDMNIEAPPEPEPLKIAKDFVMEKFQAAIIARPESKGTLVANKNRMLNKYMPHFKLDQKIANDTIEGGCYGYLENTMVTESAVVKKEIQWFVDLLKGFKAFFNLLTEEERHELIEDADKTFGTKTGQLITFLNKEIRTVETEQEFSEKQSERYVPYDELRTQVDTKSNTLDKTNIQEVQKGIVLSLYVHYPPRRNPYSTLTYGTGLNSYSNGVIILRDYKTHNTYHSLVVGDMAIFPEYHDSSKWSSFVASIFKEIIDVPLTSTNLRQNFISWNVKEGHLKFMKEKIELADAMGHSVTAQTRAYTY
ncbi:hypothetical protein DFS34DRAFT_591393 [Phlyctochytrium arcticum]|nr:hypothetical protein DFS34DRAFT_591393 [Phlyctochytrium arcticum]